MLQSFQLGAILATPVSVFFQWDAIYSIFFFTTRQLQVELPLIFYFVLESSSLLYFHSVVFHPDQGENFALGVKRATVC